MVAVSTSVNLVIVGAGVMGTALTIPASDNGHQVVLVGSPLDGDVIDSIQHNRVHPKLQVAIPASVQAIKHDDLDSALLQRADAVVLGVSSPGIPWAVDYLLEHGASLELLALVTKGLVERKDARPWTYAEHLPEVLTGLSPDSLVAIGGPCIARELALQQPTAVVYASQNATAAERLRQWLNTAYYHIDISTDVTGVEACAALKNFLAIGVSATLTQFRIPAGNTVAGAKNPVAYAFNQAVREMVLLCQWLGGDVYTATDLAGMGDLHVTVGGGRNSRLGMLLGEGLSISEALQGPLQGETVEGRDTGQALAAAIHRAIAARELAAEKLPLTLAVVQSITDDTTLESHYLGAPGQSIE